MYAYAVHVSLLYITKQFHGLTLIRVRSIALLLGVPITRALAFTDWATASAVQDLVTEARAGLILRELRSRGYEFKVCECGARPDGTEMLYGSWPHEDKEEGEDAAPGLWVCLPCWQKANEGSS